MLKLLLALAALTLIVLVLQDAFEVMLLPRRVAAPVPRRAALLPQRPG